MTINVVTAGADDQDTSGGTPRYGLVSRIQSSLHRYPALSPGLVLVVACIVFTLLGKGRFQRPDTIGRMLQQTAVIGALAIGQTIIVLTAGIDLSIGVIAIFAHVLMARLVMNNHVNSVVALALGIIVATILGAVNGMLVSRVKLPPFIVTLGTFNIFLAMGLIYSQAREISGDNLRDAGAGLLVWTGARIRIGSLTITVGVLLMLILYLVFAYVLSSTAWGRHLYAVGDDAEAAALAGIDVNKVKLSAYAAAGLIYGIGGWVLLGRAGTASTNNAGGANLDTITAVVIGGTSLFGGRGLLWGTLLGALIVTVYNTGLSLAGVNQDYRTLAIGILVIVAVALDQWIRKARK